MDRLTPRQREVAELIALGHTNGEIAARLGCNQRTVGSHRNAILGKLGVRNNVELALFVARKRKPNGHRDAKSAIVPADSFDWKAS